ncbi:hypothetical protein HY625_02035 [Candidatus Uhrbacteria bacterium]|nr:hypothetical protein [Candidatus Uhrbacteria bacterium]
MSDIITHEQYLRDLGAVALAIPERDTELIGRVTVHLEHWEECPECRAASEAVPIKPTNAEIAFRELFNHHRRNTDIEATAGVTEEQHRERWPFGFIFNLLCWKWNAKRWRENDEADAKSAKEREATGVVTVVECDE